MSKLPQGQTVATYTDGADLFINMSRSAVDYNGTSTSIEFFTKSINDVGRAFSNLESGGQVAKRNSILVAMLGIRIVWIGATPATAAQLAALNKLISSGDLVAKVAQKSDLGKFPLAALINPVTVLSDPANAINYSNNQNAFFQLRLPIPLEQLTDYSVSLEIPDAAASLANNIRFVVLLGEQKQRQA